MGRVERLFEAGDIVGESACWDDVRQRLVWVDIVGRRIHSFDPGSGDHAVWATPDLATSIGLRADGGAIVGLRKEVALWDFGGDFTPLATIEADLPDNRLNEGVVGPDGAFWVGTMQDNIAADGSPKPINRNSGAYYRVDRNGRVEALTAADYGICNSMCWRPDGTFLCSDTLANAIYSVELGGQTQSVRTFFARHPRGLPDGSAIDACGGMWNARVGGGCLVRFAEDGSASDIVELPCQAPTSCAFGGPDLSTLYVTSARFGLVEDRRDTADDGAVFAVQVPIPGVRTNRFG